LWLKTWQHCDLAGCHSLSLAPVKSRLLLPFWYRLTQVVLEQRPLNGCSSRYCLCSSPLLIAFKRRLKTLLFSRSFDLWQSWLLFLTCVTLSLVLLFLLINALEVFFDSMAFVYNNNNNNNAFLSCYNASTPCFCTTLCQLTCRTYDHPTFWF